MEEMNMQQGAAVSEAGEWKVDVAEMMRGVVDGAEPAMNAKPEKPAEAESFTLRHLGETRSVGREELIALAQKGMDYDRIRGKLGDASRQIEPLRPGGTGEVTWSSSNDNIATVDGGSVTGKAGGTATITATSGEESVTITQGARHIMFQTGDTVLVCRRLEGDFLAYRNAIPRNNTIRVEVETRALLSSIERVSLIISEKLKSPLRCIFGDGVVDITTKTAIGDAADQCPISGDGQGLEIGFNNKYLMDALKAAPAEKLRLEFTSGVAPCVILPAGGEENFIYMVLPVRLKAN